MPDPIHPPSVTRHRRLLGIAPWCLGLAAFALTLTPRRLVTQEPIWATISGAVSVGDGSTPPESQELIAGVTSPPNYGPGAEALFNGPTGAPEWQGLDFRPRAPIVTFPGPYSGEVYTGFFPEGGIHDIALGAFPWMKVAAYHRTPNPSTVTIAVQVYLYAQRQSTLICNRAVCPGQFNVKVYAAFGSVKGRVIYPDGTPVPWATVIASDPEPVVGRRFAQREIVANADGEFDFTKTSVGELLNPDFEKAGYPYFVVSGWVELANNWGLPVVGDGCGVTNPSAQCSNSPGRKTWMLRVVGKAPPVPVEIKSSKLETVVIQIPWTPPPNETEPEEPAERPPEEDKEPDPEESKTKPPNPCGEVVPNPVSVLTGNVFLDQTDAVLSGLRVPLAFVRSYNSANARRGREGGFGLGWTHPLEKTITEVSPYMLKLRQENGIVAYFTDPDQDGTYRAAMPTTERTRIVRTPTGWVRLFRRGGSEAFDNTGTLQGRQDRLGNATVLERDAEGRLVSITDPNGRQFTLGYDSPFGYRDLITSLSGPAGLIARYTYTGGRHLSTVTYVDGSGYRFTYDASGQLLRVLDLTGRVLETHTYANGKGITSEISAGRERYTLSYEENRTVVTDALGNITTHEWAEIGGRKRITKLSGCGVCGSGQETQEWTYNDQGRVITYKNGLGKETNYGYDPDGNLETVSRRPDQTTTITTRFTNDEMGRILTITRPDGGVTTFGYGPAGPEPMTQSVTETETRAGSYVYDARGLVTSATFGGKTSNLSYNVFGDLLEVRDPLGNPTAFGYDALGRLTSVTDTLGNQTTVTYDARDRIVRIQFADGTATDLVYDLAARRTTTIDPMGRHTSHFYDAYGRRERVVDAMGGVTAYGYDLMGRLTSLTDAKGNRTSFARDAYGRATGITYLGGAAEAYAYDVGGRLNTRTDRKGVVTTYSYDDLNRLLGKTYSDGTSPVTFGYDDVGRLKTASNGTDSLLWTYDLGGQVRSEASARNGTTVSYTYNALGNRETLRLDGTVLLTYGYDDASRLTRITRGNSSFDFSYDTASRRTSLTYPNGVVTQYSYDAFGRLTRAAATHTSEPITDFTYAYDSAGNRTRKSTIEYNETYAHDPLSRLTRVARDGGPYSDYVYDPVGNRTSIQVDQEINTSTFNPLNQLTSVQAGGRLRLRGVLDEPGTVSVAGRPAQILTGNMFEAYVDVVPGDNTVVVEARDAGGRLQTNTYRVAVAPQAMSFAYDANANLTSKSDDTGTWTYEWNAEDQLTRVTKDGAEVARFAYDSGGRRVEEVTVGITTTYRYDGADILGETTNGTSAYYVHGPGVDEPLAKEDASGLTYYHADALGSIVKTTHAAGVVTLVRQYDTWGNPQQGAAVAGYAFTGREWDPEIGLYYYRARYYDPHVGRFLSEDPIGLAAGVNLYRYVGDDPVNRRDAFGLWSPAAHDLLFQTTFQGRIPQADIDIMKKASRAFDVSTQGTDDAPLHYMSPDGQYRGLGARQSAMDFIQQQLKAAHKLDLAGDREGALRELAKALHTVQDSSSPMHCDQEGNPKRWRWYWPFGHNPADWIPGGEQSKDITAEILADQIGWNRALYDRVFVRRHP